MYMKYKNIYNVYSYAYKDMLSWNEWFIID